MEIFGKTAAFPADMAGLGKYSMSGYGRIGFYRVKQVVMCIAVGVYLGNPLLRPSSSIQALHTG